MKAHYLFLKISQSLLILSLMSFLPPS
jgi:hypothetical protein